MATIVRPEIRALSAYVVAKAEGLIKLDAMENPYRLPESLRQALGRALAEVSLNRYPDGGAPAVHAALREAYGIDDDLGLLLGNGSDELIQIITCALAQPGAVMLAPEPSFVMYRMNALFAGMRYVPVALHDDFTLDAAAMRAAIAREHPALVYIAYPNNPTGNLFDEDALLDIVRATPGLVVIDEAYQAFAERSFMRHVRSFPNLLILRTLSKVGMAGLRLGYAVADRAWITELDKVRPPYNLGVLTQAAAPIVLRERALLEAQAAAIRAERERLGVALAAMPAVTVYPSQTNFVTVRVPDANAWFGALKAAGILVKNLHLWHPLLTNCLRLTVGTPEENDAVLNVLRQRS